MGVQQFVVSGVPAVYGRGAFLTNPSDGIITRYDRQGVIVAVDANLSPSPTTTYLDNLDNRYIYPPSGWNA